jgi:hypothetical protein
LRVCPQVVPPNVFIGGPVRISDGFPIGAFGMTDS